MKKLRNLETLSNFQTTGSLLEKWLFRRALLAVFCLSISVTPSFALNSNSSESIEGVDLSEPLQATQVSGVVSDANGPLPGVNVLVKGTSNGALTDFDGNFEITVDSSDAILVFSYVGFKNQEVVVGNQTTLTVVLEADTESLDEVVVLGYTTRKKGDLTGAVSTVNSKVIENSSNQDLEKSLSGKVAGLIVNDRGGYPGSNETTLLIRGKSTLNNNSPLILIDGIQAASFSHLAPGDIQSLSVLKDGAAAIYGARAANGVILVTTKRGKSGKTKIQFSTSYNISTFAQAPNLMSSEQFATYENEIAGRNGKALPFSQEDIDNYASGNDPINYPNTDWADLTFRDSAPESRTSLSFSGGGENVNYFVSGDYMNREGMYASGDLGFKQYQIRSNLDIKVVDNFKVGVDLSGRFGKNSQPGVDDTYIYKHIYTNEPTEVGQYPNGLYGWGGENGANPRVMSSNQSGFVDRFDNDLRGKFSFNWNLESLTEGLSFKGYAGLRKMSNDQKSWYTPWTIYQLQGDEYIPTDGFSQSGNKNILRESFWKYNELMLNATVHYNRSFGDHSVSGFVGYEQMTSDTRQFWAERQGFPDDQHSELFAGDDEGQQSGGGSGESGRQNYFGQASYDYAKKYYIDLTLRYDGSSNFPSGNRFGTFPGVAVSWAIDKESFMENANWLDALKLRGSFAIMGNDRTGAYQFLTRYNYGGVTNTARPNYTVFGEEGTAYNGYTSANVPNEDITWETADNYNVGVNFLMFDGRFNGDINYFYQKRKDILVARVASVPDYSGIRLPAENFGVVNSFGWELDLGWNDTVKDWTYNVGVNFTNAKNEVDYLDEAANVPDALKREGHSMDSYIVYPTAGIFRDQDQVDATAVKKAGTVEGEPIYLDTNDDGKIDANDRIRTYSSITPEIQYGIYGGFSVKNFEFSILFQGQAKAEMLVFFDQSGSKPEYVYNNRWTVDNRDASLPRAAQINDPYSGNQSDDVANFEGADFYYMDASFLKLREIQIAYTLTKDVIKIGDLKLYLRGNNVATMFSDVAKFDLDPESTGYNNFRTGTYPSLSVYSFGLNFNF